MRIRGAAILAVLSAFAPACGGGGSGGGGLPLVFTALTPVDTSAPDHVVDTSKAPDVITGQLQGFFDLGGTIVFNNAGPVTIGVTAELELKANKTVVLDGKNTVTLAGSIAPVRRIIHKKFDSELTIQRLKFVDARADDEGGALRVEGGDGKLTVIDCQFQNCKTVNTGHDIGGGALRPLRQRLCQVSGSTFTDCDGSNGGAINSIGSQITLIKCVFDQCDAFGTGGGADAGGNGGIGGAVYADGVHQLANQPRLDVVGCSFTNNTAKDHGGAIFAFTYAGTGSNVFIDQCAFSGNQVTSPPTPVAGLGGAIYHQNNTITVTRSTFDGNKTIKQGGAVWSSCVFGTFENCTFQGNQATGSPGFGGALTINGSFLISSCTIAGNTAAGWGGGIFAGSPGNVALRNSLLMNNTGVDLGNGWNVNATLGGGWSNLQWPPTRGGGGPADTPALASVTFANANLSALADNGGTPMIPLKTMAIAPPSPAVDAGSSAPATDQRGETRLAAPDIGAFEFKP